MGIKVNNLLHFRKYLVIFITLHNYEISTNVEFYQHRRKHLYILNKYYFFYQLLQSINFPTVEFYKQGCHNHKSPWELI